MAPHGGNYQRNPAGDTRRDVTQVAMERERSGRDALFYAEDSRAEVGLGAMTHRRKLEAEMEAELALHLESRTEDLMRSGPGAGGSRAASARGTGVRR